jgi:hypothetical protein
VQTEEFGAGLNLPVVTTESRFYSRENKSIYRKGRVLYRKRDTDTAKNSIRGGNAQLK